jgi:AcrR family transcriptional regulator
MPKVVDHEARREELLEAVWRVIIRDGLDQATIRTFAKETGWSAGVLAHYFADKDDVVRSALKLAHERITTRWETKLAGKSGAVALRELVLDNLPLDDEREQETRLLVNYWTRRTRPGDDQPAREENWRRGPRLVDRLAVHIAEGQDAGELRTDAAPEDVADRLLAFIDGISLHALLDPDRMSRARQTALAEQELGRLTAQRPQGEDHA